MSKPKLLQRGDSNLDIIIAHIESGGTIPLTAFQEEQLEKLCYADELIRRNVGKKNREEIANLFKFKYKCHRTTAYTYMVDAEHVFSSSMPRNRKAMMGRRMDILEKAIKQALDVKNFDSAARLEKELRGYIEMYPESKVKESPRTIIFNVDKRKMDAETIELSEAEYEIQSALEAFAKQKEEETAGFMPQDEDEEVEDAD